MRPTRLLIASGAAGLIALASLAQPPTYRVEALMGSLARLTDTRSERVEAGAELRAGERLSTGARSYTELVADAAGARFSIGPSTTFRLSGTTPGVLLELERGRLRAIFDRLSGDAELERIVTTPSAVLAVRGTSYGVTVTRRGHTDVVVFDGTVAVWNAAGLGEPVLVRARERVRVERGRAPGPVRPHDLAPDDWDHGRSPMGRQASPGSGPGEPQRRSGSPGRRGGGSP